MIENAIAKENYEKATFAGGCFWCMEPPFEGIKGVVDVVSGYTGGTVKNPTYEQVCTGSTGHYEAVEITYDPSLISYENLLDIFWQNIDPTDKTGQFDDRGYQYKTAIFFHSDEQKQIAVASKDKLNKSGIFDNPVVTEIKQAQTFYIAEGYHQDFCRKNPKRYELYRSGSGRDGFLKNIWNKKPKY